MRTETDNQFRRELRQAILKYIRGCIADGTTGMGVECLLQCVRPPSDSLEGAPRGTNARYYYAQMFREVCQDRAIAPFLI